MIIQGLLIGFKKGDALIDEIDNNFDFFILIIKNGKQC